MHNRYMRFIGSTVLLALAALPTTLGFSIAESTERHLANVRQLTAGRQNAEAYFSFDGAKLIFQSTNDWSQGTSSLPPNKPASSEKGLGCYQMYVLDLETGSIRRVSVGTGATTCGYFFPGDRRVLFSSTHLAGSNARPSRSGKGGTGGRWMITTFFRSA